MIAARLGSFIAAWVMVVAVSSCEAQPKVTVITQSGRQVSFQVEIADTPAKRERGLMYRTDIPADRGMIFLFPAEAQLSFWMKNTPSPLDIIFITRERKILGIVERAVPFSLDARSVPGQSQFVLEINGSLAKQHGIAAGDTVRFEGFDAQAKD